tara:strand:- start:117 stop:1133 length:1017 start_codon:yes stop_codon:yes gene_type:complete
MRDDRIDVLRFIGLAMIIFAHVGPPEILFQLRNFDVPLMVLVSGMAFGLSYKASESYVGYIWKRVKRLVFPVWVFLTLYFLAQLIFYPSSNELNIKTILTSYALIGGIGYVWIIKVFILVAIMSPSLFFLHKRIQKDSSYFFLILVFFLFYELIRYLALPYIKDGVGQIASLVVLYLIPFSIIFSIGLRMLRMSKAQLISLSFFSLVVFVIVGFCLFVYNGEIVPTQRFKYPPSIYYFSYAVFVSGFLWVYSESISNAIEKLRIKKVVLFLASNSIWVYLWHIPLVKSIDVNFILKYFIVFVVAGLLAYIQVLTVNKLLARFVFSDKVSKNIKTVLTG